jgi:hypothetical protein
MMARMNTQSGEISPRPGDAGFATIAGAVGEIPYWGQALLRDGCRFDHVFWVVNAIGDPHFPDGRIVQAMPHGAEYQPLEPRLKPGFAYASVPLIDDQRSMVPAIAAGFVEARGGRGIGYSWLSYPAIAAVQYHIPIPHLKAYIGKRTDLICSQLVDEGLRRVGHQVFDDGRWRGDVTPGDLYYALDPRVIQPAPAAVDGA